MIVVCTCDKKYFPLLRVLVNSIQCNSPGTKIFARLVNWAENITEEEVDSLKSSYSGNIEILLDSNEQLEEPHWDQTSGLVSNFLNREKSRYTDKVDSAFKAYSQLYSDLSAYCTNIKFNSLNMLLKDRNEPLLYLDVDTIVRKPLAGLEQIILDTDLALVFATRGIIGFEKGGLIGVNCTDASRQYMQEAENNMDLFNINGDEQAFKDAYDLYQPRITPLSDLYKDEGENGFNEDSIMWSGHGDIKCYDKQYLAEQKKYEDGSNNTS